MVSTIAAPAEAPPYSFELSAELGAALDRRRAAPGGYRPRTHHLLGVDAPKYTNRLILESSPYLLQHAHNPVDWRAWGDEAFEEARRLGRPVFLSIGYATCHWCHVMEAESFEDEEIAAFMNGHYVCIKVDREERPDVDAIYMAAVQALNQSGGWPMRPAPGTSESLAGAAGSICARTARTSASAARPTRSPSERYVW